MTKYQFQLEPVRRLRAAHRDQQQVRVADALNALDQLHAQLRSIDGELADLKELRRHTVSHGAFDVNVLLDSGRYEVVLQAQRDTLREQLAAVELEAERRRATLAEAEQQVRVLDKLDERRRAEFQWAAGRREAARLDEVAAQQSLRDGSRITSAFTLFPRTREP